MGNYDEEVRFKQGGDTGENDGDSIQPIADDERLWQPILRRAQENLRLRVETIREVLKELKFESDYDRSLIFSSTGTFALTKHAGSPSSYYITSTQPLKIVPALTPGVGSGGRGVLVAGGTRTLRGARLIVGGTPYLGVLGSNDLHVYADTKLTGQRAYADGQDMNDLAVTTVGANDISFKLAVDGALGPGTIQFDDVTGTPTRHVSVRYGDGTTIGQLVTAINNDRVGGTSQSQGGGTWGVGELIQVGTTTNPPNTVLTSGSSNLITCSETVLQGGYDAEGHTVLTSHLYTLFGDTANYLLEGEGLALAYVPGPVEVGGTGGRRQSIYDLPDARVVTTLTDNTGTLAAGSSVLFVTGRYPEKIPGAIPIGKIVDGHFIFSDGTILAPNSVDDTPGTALGLGESAYGYSHLSSTTSPTGASLVGYGGSGNWNADQSASPTALAAANLETTIDSIVSQLAGTSSNQSGARRIGAEAISGASYVTAGNTEVDLTAGSIRQQLAALLSGVSTRVSENGHRMHTPAALEKRFDDVDMSSGGGQFLRAILNPPISTDADTQVLDLASMVLQPLVVNSGGTVIPATNAINHSGGAGNTQVHLSALTGGNLTALGTLLSGALNALDTFGDSIPFLVASIQGASGGTNNNGYYYVVGLNTGSALVTLRTLTLGLPDFSTTTFTGATITFYQGILVGNDVSGHRVRAYHANSGEMVMVAAAGSSNIIAKFIDSDTQTVGPSMVLTPARVRFHVDRVINAKSMERDSDHILIDEDYKLLNGYERGLLAGGPYTPLPIDASNSHHHGSKYTRYVEGNDVSPGLTWNGTSTNTVAFSAMPDYPTAASLSGFFPVGYHPVAITLRVKAQYVVTSAGAGTTFAGEIRASAGTSYSSPSSHQLAYFDGYKPTAGLETYTRNFTVTIPVNSAGQFTVSAVGLSGLTSASCNIEVFATALWCVPN